MKKCFTFVLIFSQLLLISNCNRKELVQNSFNSKNAYTSEHFGIPLDTQEITEKVPLILTGEIPSWLKGSLIRNGPGKFKIGAQQLTHWFDGFALLASFEFESGQIYYKSAYLKSDQLLESLATNSLQLEGFAQNIGRVPYKHISRDGQKTKTANANIHIEKISDNYVALGETPLPIEFEISTLKTKNIFDYNDSLKKAKIWESAHMKRDPKDNTLYNFYIDYGRDSYYVLYKIDNDSISRTLIAKHKIDKPSYMHDFSITENYIILTAYPLVVAPIDLLNPKLSFIGAHQWEPERKTNVYIFEKNTGKLVKQLITDPMFAFHHINAFEPSFEQISLYLNAYDNPNIVTEIGNYPQNYPGLSLRKLTIDLENSRLINSIITKESYEMPKVRDNLIGRMNKYFYAIWYTPSNLKQGFALTKYDIKTNQTTSWVAESHFPGEPIFIAKPGSKSEDDGVILTIVFDATHKECFLLVLNAINMKEIARAALPQILPFGIHGKFFEAK